MGETMERRVTGISSFVCLGAVAAVLFWVGSVGALEPDEACQARKNKETGKLAFCLQKAEMKLVKTKGACSVTATTECYRDDDCPGVETCDKDLTRYNTHVAKCEGKFSDGWGKGELKGGGSCPDGSADPSSMLGFVTDHSDAVTQALAGGGLPQCGDDTINVPGEECDGTDLAGKTCTTFGMVDGMLACSGCVFDTSACLPASVPSAFPASGQTTAYGPGSDGNVRAGATLSYTDNGDGTITDNNTGLMWEKKDQSGGIHDYGNVYSWGMTSSPYTMNGTMVTTFLATLNTTPCFAGYCDWRIPNYKELTSILDLERYDPAVAPVFNTGCASGCTVDGVGGPMCSCTRSNNYWSSTTNRFNEGSAWGVNFDGGNVNSFNKSFSFYVRAVRGGL